VKETVKEAVEEAVEEDGRRRMAEAAPRRTSAAASGPDAPMRKSVAAA